MDRGLGFEKDPGFLESPRSGFEEHSTPDGQTARALRMSWIDHAESLFDAPLVIRYSGLDPQAGYKIRVVYAGDSFKRKIRLLANDGIEIHPFIQKEFPVRPVEFEIPMKATAGGDLILKWYREPGLGGNGRGCQVSEVWLMKE